MPGAKKSTPVGGAELSVVGRPRALLGASMSVFTILALALSTMLGRRIVVSFGLLGLLSSDVLRETDGLVWVGVLSGSDALSSDAGEEGGSVDTDRREGLE